MLTDYNNYAPIIHDDDKLITMHQPFGKGEKDYALMTCCWIGMKLEEAERLSTY